MRRLLGAHLPAASPERRETVAGECLGCQTQFVIDVRLPLPATCPDCGGRRARTSAAPGCHSTRCGSGGPMTLRSSPRGRSSWPNSGTRSWSTRCTTRRRAWWRGDGRAAVGWRSAGRPRQWVWSVFPSLGQAVRVARGYAACVLRRGLSSVTARSKQSWAAGWRRGSRRIDRTDAVRLRIAQADVCQACGLVRLTSYRTGQVVRYAGSGAATAYQR